MALVDVAAPNRDLQDSGRAGRAAGLTAGLLLALSPFFVQYEQTARSYALLGPLVSLSSYLFGAELEQPSSRTQGPRPRP